MLIFFFIAIITAWICYVRLKLKGPSLRALVLKMLTTLFIIFFASTIVIQHPTLLEVGFVVIIALIFGLIGDIVLDLKLIYPQHNDFYTYFGFTAFILGHLVYIGYFLLNYPLNTISYSFIFGFAGMSVFMVLMTEIPMKLNFGKFRIISSIYAFILTFIMCLAFWIGGMYSNLGLWMFGGGMALFLISDLILSHSYFGEQEKPWMIIGNYLFYYSAQLTIAASMLWI
ncbi:MAG TPA: lysoplasmalogenase [Faecalibacter sp.]